ncbi:MAG: hypothetical protein K5978_01685 [Campylobacter sp.]|nr:hypothetical protein [Campylobacter sp.]
MKFWDKTLRLVAGLGIAVVCGDSPWMILALWFIITAVYGCPLYKFFKK